MAKRAVPVDLRNMLRLCEEYAKVGSMVQAQWQDVCHGEDPEEQNPHALQEFIKFLRLAEVAGIVGAADKADELDDYLKVLA